MTKQIPEGWQSITLKDVYDFKNGLNKEKSAFGSGTPIVNYMDVYKNHELKISRLKGLVTLNKNELSNFEVKRGDVFFTRTSETIDEIGLTAVMNDDCENVVFSGFLLRARPKNNLITTNYAKYCFLSPIVRDEIKQKSSCTTRALTSGKMLGDVEVILPKNPEEQDKIVEILDVWAKAVELQEQKVEKLKEKKKALMQKLLTSKADWVKVSLNKLVEAKPSNLLIKNIKDKEGNYPVYGAEGVSLMVDFYKYDCDSIGIITYGSGCGKVCYITGKHSVLGTLTELHACSNINLKYVYYVLSNFDFTKYKEISTTPNIYFDDFGKEIFSIPNRDEQNKIVAVLDNIDCQIDKNIVYSEKLKMQQKALMQKLLTGEIRV